MNEYTKKNISILDSASLATSPQSNVQSPGPFPTTSHTYSPSSITGSCAQVASSSSNIGSVSTCSASSVANVQSHLYATTVSGQTNPSLTETQIMRITAAAEK